jgi:hypothetical protein
LFEEFAYVGQVQHHATPREVARSIVLPFPIPSVETNPAAQSGVLKRCRASFPALADARLLFNA